MAATMTPVTASTTRWTVNTLAAQLAAELSSDANASGASVPAKKLTVVRNCAARLWEVHDWRHRRRRFTLDVWPTQTGTCTGVYDGTSTTVTANTGTFYESMIGHNLVVTGTGAGTYAIASYTSATVIVVTGNCAASASAWTVTADKTYYLKSWMAKLDQRWLMERDHDATEGCRITEDVQEFQRIANRIDQDQTGTEREPAILCVVRNPGESSFLWYAMTEPATDDVYQYNLWAVTRNPFDAGSQSDSAAMPWPDSFDQVWEHFARWMMAISFGSKEDGPALKNIYDAALEAQKKDNDETLVSPTEYIDQDPYGDWGMLLSQLATPALRSNLWQP